MIVASFGGGVNSTAMLIGMVERGEHCDLILFADTGGEKPHTYEHVERFSKWLKFVGMPEIVTVRSPNTTLEADVLKRHTLPSIAFGFKTCSQRFKREPCEKYLNGIGAKDVQMLIGFDADEPHRAKPFPGNRYPLLEWDWGRDECVEACRRIQMVPGKSACFFCPSSKKWEILELQRRYPDLAARSVAMEANADLTSIKGLGRDFSWTQLLAFDKAQIKMFVEDSPIAIDCGCYDGEPA